MQLLEIKIFIFFFKSVFVSSVIWRSNVVKFDFLFFIVFFSEVDYHKKSLDWLIFQESLDVLTSPVTRCDFGIFIKFSWLKLKNKLLFFYSIRRPLTWSSSFFVLAWPAQISIPIPCLWWCPTSCLWWTQLLKIISSLKNRKRVANRSSVSKVKRHYLDAACTRDQVWFKTKFDIIWIRFFFHFFCPFCSRALDITQKWAKNLSIYKIYIHMLY